MYLSIYVYVNLNMCLYMYIFVYMYAHIDNMYICICICIYVFVYVCIHVCVNDLMSCQILERDVMSIMDRFMGPNRQCTDALPRLSNEVTLWALVNIYQRVWSNWWFTSIVDYSGLLSIINQY